jgi:hypothetical protein
MPLSHFLSRQNMRPYTAFVSSYRYCSGTNINIIVFHLWLAHQSFEILNFQLQQHEQTCLVVADMTFFQKSGLLNPAVKSANAHFMTGVYILRLPSWLSPHFSLVLIERFNAIDAPRCVIYIRIAIRKGFIDFLILAFCDLLRESLLRYQYSFFCYSSFSIVAYLFFLPNSQLRVLN